MQQVAETKDLFNPMISVVIITKNEAGIIGETLESLQGISDDIIIIDSGSTDETLNICRRYKTRIVETTWDGYGNNKNKGIELAKNSWILSLDADESIDAELNKELRNVKPDQDNIAYIFKYKNFFCRKWIRYGVWGKDKHVRLFNKQNVRWDTAAVHESLIFPAGTKFLHLKGNILHYTVNSIDTYSNKTVIYARANAKKYFLLGKKSGFAKRYLSPPFNFIKHYYFRLGFLDGWEGYLICKTYAWYTFMKYVYLKELIDADKNKSV